MLLTSCGNRRETVCPSCSQVYKRDARQLVRAGLSGGKGIPDTIAAHPCVFATLTAPSFGPVHSRRMRGKTVLPCRPRRDANARRCPHGRDISCPRRHGEDDPRLGRPLCGDCYDYDAAVLFNACAGDLWRRFTTYLPRCFARLPGSASPALRQQVAIRYVKVAEYQARGVVHFHAIIRLDAPGDTWQPPAPGFTAAMLADAIAQAATAAAITTGPVPGRPAVTLRFGTQTDARPVRHAPDLPGTGRALSVQAVANYIAKYATKALDAPGIPDRPIRSALDLEALRCHAHYRRMITTAWRLGGGQLTPGPTRLCKWAHMLGYGGHFLTKSRRYSTTFGSPAPRPHRAPQAATPPRRRTRPLGPAPRRARRPGPAHLDLRRNRLHHRPRRRARARLRRDGPRPPPGRHRRLTLPARTEGAMPHDDSHRPAADRRSGRRNPGDRRTVPPAAHRGTADPVRPGRPTRPHPRIRAARVHRGRARRTCHPPVQEGCLMPNSRGRRRRFGAVRELRSGQWQARYRGPDGIMRPADRTFPDKTAAEVWLTRKEAEILNGDWLDPDAGRILFGEYAHAWIDERPGLRPKSIQLYRYLLRRHLAPAWEPRR